MWVSTPLFASCLAAACAGMAGAVELPGDVKSIPLRTHSLSQPYLDAEMQSRWWDFGGDTTVRRDKYIRLTADKPSRDGWFFSRVPLTATNWEIEFEFAIHGAGNLHGDGMAMWLTKQRGQQGVVFGSADNFEGLGIFFDTYKNNRPGTIFPYVMAMFGDGQTSYDKHNDGKMNEYAGCSARGIRSSSVPTKARLTYFQDKSLTLELQYKAEDEWVVCFDKENPPAIPGVAYLGFSAGTGELSDNHDIISVQTKNLYSASRLQATSLPKGKYGKPDKSKGKGGSWLWFFGKIILGGGLVGGAYVGYTAWRAGKLGNRSHRF